MFYKSIPRPNPSHASWEVLRNIWLLQLGHYFQAPEMEVFSILITFAQKHHITDTQTAFYDFVYSGEITDDMVYAMLRKEAVSSEQYLTLWQQIHMGYDSVEHRTQLFSLAAKNLAIPIKQVTIAQVVSQAKAGKFRELLVTR